ncbi:MAG: cobalamin B12-binding domain-containing protein [Acidobacteria bacterium]|nr:cobalamin B12-binding domain-containing protein [Acidobacteriota bacterium]
MNYSPTKFLTTRQLSRVWFVSEATIKRWADTGQLKSSRTVGGHRRFPLAEVMRFQTERGLGAAAGVAPTATLNVTSAKSTFDAEQAAEQFFEAARRGHAGEATALLLEAHMLGAELHLVFDEVVAPSLRRVGDLWYGEQMSVAEEHLATSTATRAVESLAASTRRAGAKAGAAVCCAAEEEMHTLPVLCAQAILEGAGWDVRNLGGHTPFFALAEYIEKQRPALVCVSATLQRALEHNARDYAQLTSAARACGARVVLGGEGFRDRAVRARFPADLHAEGFRDLSEFVRGLD